MDNKDPPILHVNLSFANILHSGPLSHFPCIRVCVYVLSYINTILYTYTYIHTLTFC